MAEKRKPKLHELLAVETTLNNTAKAMVEEAKVAFTKKTEHFRGLIQTVTYFDEARSQENTKDEKVLVSTVGERLDYALKYVGDYYDAILQKEATNALAKADLVIDGETFGTDIPATWLLGMETRLESLRDLLLSIPTNDPTLAWEDDTTAAMPGIFKAPPVERMKTEQVLMHKVLVAPTDKHPAQIEKWQEQKPVAKITLFNTSGMWTPLRKATVIARLDKVLLAVKKSRQRANDVEVVDTSIADKLLGFITKS